MNRIICHNFNFQNEELVDYYISMLKSIALRLNTETIKFFFNEVKIKLILFYILEI